jgi:hypothetical protein
LQSIGEMVEARRSQQGLHGTRASNDAIRSSEGTNRTRRT